MGQTVFNDCLFEGKIDYQEMNTFSVRSMFEVLFGFSEHQIAKKIK